MENEKRKYIRKKPHNKKASDYIGVRVGYLTIIGVLGTGINAIARCKCDCGNTCEKKLYNLLSRRNKSSCGCHYGDWCRTHGRTRTQEYRSWRSMKERCYDKTSRAYKNYGGRGISICERWLNSFENFLNDMGERPGPGYSIDRIDCNGDYCPENCRWADKYQQARNRRDTIMITYHGTTLSSKEWEELIGCRVNRLWEAKQRGFDMEKYIDKLYEIKRVYGHCNMRIDCDLQDGKPRKVKKNK